MVQCLLIVARARKVRAAVAMALLAILIAVPVSASKRKKAEAAPPWPELLLEGGRKLSFERTLSSEREIRGKPGFWTKLADIVVGEPDFKQMVRPYGIAVDSRGRVIVTDPGMAGVHVFDAAQHKYKFLERQDRSKDEMFEPQCVAVDSKDNIYVTDSKSGRIFVFDSNGKYRRVIGSLKGGEGFFKRPTGIAIDPETQNIYVTDTLRDRVYVLDNKGLVLRTIGRRGVGDGEFNTPTEVSIKNGIVAVVDAMNFRVQLFDREGTFKGAIGAVGDPTSGIFRPKGIAVDSEDHVYLVESQSGLVQVFDREGHLLYYFGNGTGFGRFQLPAGLFIDGGDRVYVVDSYNHRVQVFQYRGLKTRAGGGNQ